LAGFVDWSTAWSSLRWRWCRIETVLSWIVYLTGRSQVLEGRYQTEFDAMAACEVALHSAGSWQLGLVP
jgi:hypothetical protein